MRAKLDEALEALQLCLKLLPQSSREELRTLLTFLSLAADPHGIKLDKEVRALAPSHLDLLYYYYVHAMSMAAHIVMQ